MQRNTFNACVYAWERLISILCPIAEHGTAQTSFDSLQILYENLSEIFTVKFVRYCVNSKWGKPWTNLVNDHEYTKFCLESFLNTWNVSYMNYGVSLLDEWLQNLVTVAMQVDAYIMCIIDSSITFHPMWLCPHFSCHYECTNPKLPAMVLFNLSNSEKWCVSQTVCTFSSQILSHRMSFISVISQKYKLVVSSFQ